MTIRDDEWRRLPLMLGTDQVCFCLGISRAKIYRMLAQGRMQQAVKIGSTNGWAKEYIRKISERGFDPPGTHGPPTSIGRDGDAGAPATR